MAILTLLLLTIAVLGPVFQLSGYFSQGVDFIGRSYAQLASVLVVVSLSALASLRLLYRRSEDGSRYTFRRRYRRVAGFLFALNLLLFIGFGLGWFFNFRKTQVFPASAFPQDRYGIALALFGEGRAMAISDSAFKLMDRLERDAGREARRVGSQWVVIRCVGPVRDAGEAAKRGLELGAELVVWGWMEPGRPDAVFPALTKVASGASLPALEPEHWMANAQGVETIPLANEYPIPASWLPSIIVGVACLNIGEYEAAIPLFTRVLESVAENGGEGKDFARLVSALYLYRGRAYAALGRRDLSSDDFIASGRSLPNAVAQIELGNLFYAEGNLGEALRAYRQAMALDPYNLACYIGVGNVYYVQGEFERAIEQYRQALHIRPDFAPAYYALGLSHRELGAVLLARDAFNKCIVLAEDNMELKSAANQAVQALSQIPVTVTPVPVTLSTTSEAGPESATQEISSPSPPVGGTPSSPRTYTVRRGDNLTSIAQHFNVSVEAIVRANNLRNANAIYVGQELIIPSE